MKNVRLLSDPRASNFVFSHFCVWTSTDTRSLVGSREGSLSLSLSLSLFSEQFQDIYYNRLSTARTAPRPFMQQLFEQWNTSHGSPKPNSTFNTKTSASNTIEELRITYPPYFGSYASRLVTFVACHSPSISSSPHFLPPIYLHFQKHLQSQVLKPN